MNRKASAVGASLLAGLLVTLLIQLNSGLGKVIGVLESCFVAHLTGSILGFLIIATTLSRHSFRNAWSIPKYLYVGGVLGVILTVIGNIVIPHIGALLYGVIMITLDLAFSTAIDHFGLFGLPKFPVNGRRIAGLLISLTGVLLIMGACKW